jgi:epoxyqueuosine reductase
VPLTSSAIKTRALGIGFDRCGIAPVGEFPELRFLGEWIGRGYAGRMAYMARTAGRRADARQVVPSARSVIVTASVYNVDRPYSVEVSDRDTALVSRYAWGDDYHRAIGARLESLLAWMREASTEPFEARAYVDTGPVQERVYAQYAGVGWIGKNTCVIDPELGSWLFLGEILCSLPLEPDPPALDQCGTCALCLEACPTGAFVEPRVLDATRCLSYLTIELKDAIPEDKRPDLGAHIFGCDICQEVCPWNATPARSRRPEWQPRPGLDRPRLVDLWRSTDEELQSLVQGTPLTRPTLTGLRRNVAVAIGNSANQDAADVLACEPPAGVTAGAPSRYDPLVREHARWAVGRLRASEPREGR